jgi:hypothetical protein
MKVRLILMLLLMFLVSCSSPHKEESEVSDLAFQIGSFNASISELDYKYEVFSEAYPESEIIEIASEDSNVNNEHIFYIELEDSIYFELTIISN